MRFPTDQKLLWESVDWTYGQLRLMCKYTGAKIPRTKFLKWKERYWSYSRKRRKPTEESFGKGKQHYLLNRIAARTRENEILWIFIGIHTGNALEIRRRIHRARQDITSAA